MSSLGIGSKQALQILKKGFDNTSGIVLQAVPPKKVTIEQILDPIEKDLEVLEILKKHLYKGSYETDEGEVFEIICLIGLNTQFDIDGKEYKKVEEWMKNE